MPDNRDLLAAVEAWARVNYPGCPLELVSIQLRYLPAPIQLPACPGRAEPETEAEGDERGRGLSRCVLDILQTLREVRRPLTRTKLLEEMEKKNRIWAESTVGGHLARLVEDGTLANPESGRPRGYRLTDED